MIPNEKRAAQAESLPATPLLSMEELRALAARHGFDDVKVTDAAPHSEAARLFRAWVARGDAADMDWLTGDPLRRASPQQHVAGARSVLTFAVNYFRAAEALPAGQGRVARYAAGEDYHRVLDDGLKAVIAALRARAPDAGCHYYVDYGPILERAFAERAGLGFIGRSANLIHPAFGTYVFLATIVTDAWFLPTPPAPGTCGQCRRCLDVCPTGALKNPFEVDARLCISYLTIENCGPIPRHLRPSIGDWLFGCDRCQEVCPYNDRARVGTHARIVGRTVAGTSLDLAEILSLRHAAEFSRRFSRSPLKRAKREGLLRNAAVVAGNLRQAALLPALHAALQDASALVRGHVVWALIQHDDLEPVRALRTTESDPWVRSEIDAGLGPEPGDARRD